MTETDRNAKIGKLYEEGYTQQEVADKFQLTRARVAQILRALGVPARQRTLPTGNGRTEFLGVNLSPEVKKKLRHKAVNEGKSASKFVSDLIEKNVEA